jgi:hypothetical protein
VGIGNDTTAYPPEILQHGLTINLPDRRSRQKKWHLRRMTISEVQNASRPIAAVSRDQASYRVQNCEGHVWPRSVITATIDRHHVGWNLAEDL